jgi:hypothetical protein
MPHQRVGVLVGHPLWQRMEHLSDAQQATQHELSQRGMRTKFTDAFVLDRSPFDALSEWLL